MVSGYSYPQLTREAKEKIFWRNLASLMGSDVEQKAA
jgi:hypothetical protein